MQDDQSLRYAPAAHAVETAFGIDPATGLTAPQQRKARLLLRDWAVARGLQVATLPTPDLSGVRWSADQVYLLVPPDSGLYKWGFDSLFDEHAPRVEGAQGRIYDHYNPAAHALLAAIRQAVA